MRGLNKVQLIGNLGADPEIRYTQAGDPVANVRLATNFSYKDRSGEKREHTEWHRVVVFGKLAEFVGHRLKKGSPVYFEGRIRTRRWQKDHVTHYTTEVIPSEMILIGGNASADDATNQASQAATDVPEPDIDDGANTPF